MQTYELTLIFKPELTEEQSDAIIDKLGVRIKTREKWGKRLLTYPIKKHKEGMYYLCEIEGEATALKELEKTVNVDESVLRYLLIRKHNKKSD